MIFISKENVYIKKIYKYRKEIFFSKKDKYTLLNWVLYYKYFINNTKKSYKIEFVTNKNLIVLKNTYKNIYYRNTTINIYNKNFFSLENNLYIKYNFLKNYILSKKLGFDYFYIFNPYENKDLIYNKKSFLIKKLFLNKYINNEYIDKAYELYFEFLKQKNLNKYIFFTQSSDLHLHKYNISDLSLNLNEVFINFTYYTYNYMFLKTYIIYWKFKINNYKYSLLFNFYYLKCIKFLFEKNIDMVKNKSFINKWHLDDIYFINFIDSFDFIFDTLYYIYNVENVLNKETTKEELIFGDENDEDRNKLPLLLYNFDNYIKNYSITFLLKKNLNFNKIQYSL